MPRGYAGTGIRPGYVERGIEYARGKAREDGYWTARNGLPLPLASSVRPYGVEWREGYAAGIEARKEYDHAEAVRQRPESKRRVEALDRSSAPGGAGVAGGVEDARPAREPLAGREPVSVHADGAEVAVGLDVRAGGVA